MKDSDDDDNGDSVYSLKSKKDTDTEFEIVNTIPISKNKGFNTLLAYFHY